MQKILIFRSGALGDVLMTTPLVRAIRKKYPKAHITYLTGNWSKDAISGNKNIDELIAFDDMIITKKRVFSLLGLISKIKKNNFDIAFILDKSEYFGLLVKLAKVKERIGFDRNGEGKYNTKNVLFEGKKHEIDYYMDIAKLIGADYKDDKMELFLSKEERKFAESFIKKNKLKKTIVGIAPGGAKNPGQEVGEKRWPKERYIELINRLKERYKGVNVILFGGKEDYSIGEEIRNKTGENVINACGKTTIKQAAAVISHCKLFITHDSGLMHIAAAMNAPLIALFGPTPKERFAPKNSIAIETKTKPCYTIYGEFKNCKRGQMDEIGVDEVLNKVKIIVKN